MEDSAALLDGAYEPPSEVPGEARPAGASVAASKRAAIALAIALLLAAPLLGSFARWGGLPPHFVFPPEQGLAKAPFNVPLFVLFAAVAGGLVALVAVPRLFGFAPALPDSTARRGKLAPWFWPALAILLFGWFLMWEQPSALASLVPFAFTPQWWGFILVLDAIVYARSNGRSLLATRPRTFLALALVSCAAWYLYEYLNLFLLENWYYPVRSTWSKAGYVVAYSAAYTTVTPAVIEWYLLLKTFPRIATRFARGPKIAGAKKASLFAIALGLVLTALSSIWPSPLFFVIWFGPDLVLAGVLGLLAIWTPLTPLARGDFTRVVLPAVAAMINGVFWEGWNYFSQPSNPHFWKYDVPYVGVFHVFEMPLLGFFGYAPFGVSVWLTWIAFATVAGIDPALEG